MQVGTTYCMMHDASDSVPASVVLVLIFQIVLVSSRFQAFIRLVLVLVLVSNLYLYGLV